MSSLGRKLGHALDSVVLTAKSFAFIARNGKKPNGALKICRAHIEIPETQFELYRQIVQMETDKLDMPEKPEVVLNFIEVSDADYREFQFLIRASHKGEDHWYLNHILINNFIGWIYGLKDYGFNKYLYPVDYKLSVTEPHLVAAIPADEGYFRARFVADDTWEPAQFSDDGSYSIKTGKPNKLIHCSSAPSDITELVNADGYLEITENSFVEHQDKIDYPVNWSRLIPLGRHKAHYYVGQAKEVAMTDLIVRETW